MGVRISDPRHVCLYCSTSGTAFGPVFADSLEAEEFLGWLPAGDDPRDMRDDKLLSLYQQWKETQQ